MPGRHRSAALAELPGEPGAGGRGKAVLAGVGVGGLVVALSVAGWAILRPTAESAAQCVGSVTLRVTAAPDIAPSVGEIATAYNATKPQAASRCVDVVVKSAPSAKVAADIVAAKGILPNLWIPDSSLWAEQVRQGTQNGAPAGSELPPAQVEVSGTLASSPLVVVAPRPVAQAIGGEAQAFSWSGVLDGKLPATVPDPSTTSEGLTAALTLNKLFGGEQTRQQLTGALLKVARTAVPDVAVAYEAISVNPEKAPVFPASEQSVIAHNRVQPDAPVSALYASEGTYGFDYPTIRVTTNETPTSLDQAAERFEEVLSSPDSVAALQRAGFRASDGTSTGFTAELGVLPANPTILGTPQLAEAATLLKALSALSLDARLLAVIDVSGSMEAQTPEGSRIALAVDAAKAAVGLFSNTSEVGLWAFSVDHAPPQDWTEIVPVRPINAAVGETTQAQLLTKGVESLPGITGGGTGLYDTALAAFRSAKAGYDPGKVNSVVLMTDGQNDEPRGISLETLLTNLRAEFDPAQPVMIITIGMGPDVDLDVLQQISATTGAKAYEARDPAQIQAVFLDAMTARTTR